MYNAIISTQVLDENDYLDEWVRYHLGIGFDHIVIYDNKSTVPVQNLWGDKVTVILEDRKFQSSDDDNCHNDTLKNFDANWIARIDVDEFIVLKKHDNINELLEPYKEFGGLGINWRIFGTSGHIKKPTGKVVDNYLWRVPDSCTEIINGGSSHLKTIVRREFCVKIHQPHFCLSTRQLVNEDFVPYLHAWTNSSRKLSVIHHYVTKSLDEWNFKYELWRNWSTNLRTPFHLNEIEKNCIIYDDTLKSKDMINKKTFQWATHQPLIKGVLDLYDPGFVLELGIGEYSTPLFLKYKYLGIENNPDWVTHIKEKYTKLELIHHDLDKQEGTLQEYYNSISVPNVPGLLFVDNYESCRMIAINTLRDKFDLIIFHDCEPGPGARINRYSMINSEGFNTYFLKTSANWTGVMVRKVIDKGFTELSKYVNPYVNSFISDHPDMQWMRLSNKYGE